MMKFFALVWFTLIILLLNVRLNSTTDDEGRGKRAQSHRSGKEPVSAQSENPSKRPKWNEKNDEELIDIFNRVHGNPERVQIEWDRAHPERKSIYLPTLKIHVNKLLDQGLIKGDEDVIKRWRRKRHRLTDNDAENLMHLWYENYKGNQQRDFAIILEKWQKKYGKTHNLTVTKMISKVDHLLAKGIIIFPAKLGGVPVKLDKSTKKERNLEGMIRQQSEFMMKHDLGISSSTQSVVASQAHDQRLIPQEFSNPAVAHHGQPNYGGYFPEQHYDHGGQEFYHDPSAAYHHLMYPQSQFSEHHTSHSEDTFHTSSSNPHYSHGHLVHESNVHSKQSSNQQYHAQEPAIHQSQILHGDSQFQNDNSLYNERVASLHFHPPLIDLPSPTDNIFEFNWSKIWSPPKSPGHK